MECPNEFILSQYADGELPRGETAELAAHLETCRACREEVAGFKTENQLLVESLQGIDLCETEREAVTPTRLARMSKSRMAASLIGVAILLRVGLSVIRDIELPPVLQWLHPLSLAGLLNWLVNGLFYLTEEGGAVVTTLVKEAGFAVLGCLILVVSIAVTRRAIRAKVLLGLISLLLAFVLPGYATDIRKAPKGQSSITVASSETVNDTLVAFADSVYISGTITGDLIAFARQVNVQGTVQGNVICFGQKIDLTGDVNGDIFVFGQLIQVDGRVGQSLWGFGQILTLGRSMKLDHDAMLFGSNTYINGDVGRDAMVFSGTLDFGSKLGRDLRFQGGRLLIHAPTVIGRNLESVTPSAKGVIIDPTVTIVGNKSLEVAKTEASRYRTLGFYGKEALRIGAAFLMGLILFWLIPGIRRIPLSTARVLLTSCGIGFLAAVAAPVAAVIMAITLIGLPIALVVLAVWLLGLYLAKIVIAKWIGSAIMGAGSDGLSSTFLPLLIGLVIVIIAVNLPYVGGILNFLLMLIGLGALVVAVYRTQAAGAHRS